MKPITLEWVERAEGDYASAHEEDVNDPGDEAIVLTPKGRNPSNRSELLRIIRYVVCIARMLKNLLNFSKPDSSFWILSKPFTFRLKKLKSA